MNGDYLRNKGDAMVILRWIFVKLITEVGDLMKLIQ
jgi:hypothetical protein